MSSTLKRVHVNFSLRKKTPQNIEKLIQIKKHTETGFFSTLSIYIEIYGSVRGFKILNRQKEPFWNLFSLEYCNIPKKQGVRCSHQRCSMKKMCFQKFIGNHLRESLFFNKVAALQKEALAQEFSCEFCTISKNTFSQNNYGRLLV